MMWNAPEAMGWWMLVGGLFWVGFVALPVYVLAQAMDGRPRAPREGERESAVDLARRRYAAGELSEEEFKRVRDNLAR